MRFRTRCSQGLAGITEPRFDIGDMPHDTREDLAVGAVGPLSHVLDTPGRVACSNRGDTGARNQRPSRPPLSDETSVDERTENDLRFAG